MTEQRADPHRVLANTAWRTLADLGSKVASLVLYVVMARELGATQFGVYTFALAFAAIVTILANLGQDVVLTREVSRDRERVHEYFFNTIVQKLSVAGPVLLAACAILGASHATSHTVAVTLIVGAGVLFEDLTNTCSATFQAYERLAFVTVVLIAERWAAAIVGIAVVLAGGGVAAVAGVYATAAAAAFFLAYHLLRRSVVRPRRHIHIARARRLLWEAVPVGVSMVFAMLLFRVDATMLAAFEPEAEVGAYGVAYRLFEATLFLAWAVGAAVYPVLSRLNRESEPPLHRVFESGLKLGIALTLPLAVAAGVLGPQLVHVLYGNEFSRGGRALQLLAPTLVLYPICYLAGGMLVSQNRQRVLTIAYAVIAAENILLNFWLIPKWSLYGAAAGTTISQALLCVPLLLAAHAASGVLDWRRTIGGPVVAAAVAGVAMLSLDEQPLAVSAVVGAAAFCLVLAVYERLVNPADAHMLVRFLRRA